MILLFVACSSAPAPSPPEPAPFTPAPHPPAMRVVPPMAPADPASFTVRPDGLGILDEVVGEGAIVAEGVVVVAEITSWAPDGAMWDSTWERREPTRFVVGGERVVAGWDQGVVGMRVGGVRQLLVPPSLGFEEGIAGRLPNGASSITRVDLLEILVPPTAPDGVEVPGEGAELLPGVTARIDYVGWLPDGTAFDTTYTRPAPFAFTYGPGVVRWESALAGMRVGGRREIRIPADQAFGVEGRPPVIPPGADLVFTVDLRSVE